MTNLEEKVIKQQAVRSISKQLWDVAIIGAGPAGAMAAAHLAEKHHRVILLDRKKFPREKVCGDGLLNDALRCLDTIGVSEKVRAIGLLNSTSVLISPSQKEVEIPGEYLTIKRSLLDMLVAQKAVERGAVFVMGAVKQLGTESDGLASFTIQGSDQKYRARIVILATGADIRLLQNLNWSARKKPSGFGLRCYVRSSFALKRLVFFFIRHGRFSIPGYGWIFPMRDHEYNVGIGLLSPGRMGKGTINLRKQFNVFLSSYPLARALMQQSDRTTDMRAAALRYDFEGAYPFVKGPIVAVGEAIGTTLPFIGEGIGKAMESGQMAADAVNKALKSDDLSKLLQYSQQIESEFKALYREYRVAERWLARPWLNDFVIGRFGSSRYAQEILAGVVAKTRSPQEIFSLRGILKTLWK